MLGTTRLFCDKTILIFEDGFLLSEEAQQKLVAWGAHILGPVNTAEHVLRYLSAEAVDAVILDVMIEPETVLPVIAALEHHDIPFIFAVSSNPSLDGQRFAGFILSALEEDLTTIASALFGQRQLVQ